MQTAQAIGVIGEGLLEVGFGADLGLRELRRGYGGDAANIAVMAANIGTPTRLLTRVGDDAAGRALSDFWRGTGIASDWVTLERSAPTGVYVNELLPSGAHRFDYHRLGSAAERLTTDDLTTDFYEGLWGLVITGITLSLSPGADRLARKAASEATHKGVRLAVVANCRPARSEDFRSLSEMLRLADIAILSEEDSMHLLGTDSPEEVVAALGRVGGETIITLGDKGALLFSDGESQFARPLPIERLVDGAGAGDALAGAYLGLRARNSTPSEAFTFAVAAASMSCREAGCGLSYPDFQQVERVLEPPVPVLE